jgi:beta propeller repeat protein
MGSGKVVYERISNGSQLDIDCYGCSAGTISLISDANAQRRPRVSGNFVVFESYSDPVGSSPSKSSVMTYNVYTRALHTIAVAPASLPDIDDDRVVWVAGDGDNQHIYWCALNPDGSCDRAQQLTQTASRKEAPRISGSRVVWADRRDPDAGADIYIANLDDPTAGEQLLVGGPGDQSRPDLDGNRLVYVANTGDDTQVRLYALPALTEQIPPGCDDSQTTVVGSAVTQTVASRAPLIKTAALAFTAEAGKVYYLCIENGLPDGSQRVTKMGANQDGLMAWVIPLTQFGPIDTPRWLTGTLPALTGGASYKWYGAYQPTATPYTVTFTLRQALAK